MILHPLSYLPQAEYTASGASDGGAQEEQHRRAYADQPQTRAEVEEWLPEQSWEN